MKTKIKLTNTLLPREEDQRLVEKFNNFWVKHINREIKRKFLYQVYKNYPKIKAFRTNHGIPKEGFKTQKEVANWFGKKVRKTKQATKGTAYNEKIIPYENLGLILKEEKPTQNVVTAKGRKTEKAAFIGLYQKALEEFSRDIGLDNSWDCQFDNYILFNIEEMRWVTDSGIRVAKKLKSYGAGDPVKGQIVLEFSPNTRLKDIQFIWQDQVKPLQKQLPGYIKIPPNANPKKPTNDC